KANTFLMRLQGSLHITDPPMAHMFSRYMYLQAKKIIDKHGWLVKKPITKSNPAGLIQTVAIHLLTFAIYDGCNGDAEELVLDGFQQLLFNAVEQYPHCGMMWYSVTSDKYCECALKRVRSKHSQY
ncbi:hypothetical protein PMAYCL1PPCAC_14010, partial [Pristionchus mayeri]